MELEQLIEKIDTLKTELDELRPIQEDRLNRLNQKMRLDWNFHSNSIEGNTLSVSETKAFLLHGITAKGKPFRDYLEMRGHNEALKKLESIVHNELKITENLIKEFHKMILVEPYADNQSEINPGQYKTLPNYLYSTTGERIDFVAPEEVAEKMNSLVNWLNNHISPPKRKKRQYDKHPLLIATIFHLEFINIHPLGDGNGRMARILMNLIFMLTGYTPAIIKLEKREEYYANLNLSSAENATPFATYLGEALIESLTLAIKAAKGESIEDKDDLDKQIDLLYREISPENILKEKATSLNVSNIIEKNIFPLLMELEEKCSKLHNLFFDFDRNMQFNYKDSQSLKSLGTKESIWKDIIENWLNNQIIKQQQLLTEFTYSYVLKGLKKSIKGNSIDFKIDIYFKDYTYLIIDSRNEYEYPYDKILTESEIKNIITPIVTKLIERIRQYSTND